MGGRPERLLGEAPHSLGLAYASRDPAGKDAREPPRAEGKGRPLLPTEVLTGRGDCGGVTADRPPLN